MGWTPGTPCPATKTTSLSPCTSLLGTSFAAPAVWGNTGVGEERAELVSKAVMGQGHAGGAAARWALLSLLGLGMLTAAAAIDEFALNSLSSSDARTI